MRPASDRLELLRRVLFNYLISDAHGKNFAFLLGDGGTWLAPAYDLICTSVYSDHNDRMAMKIGTRDRFLEILPRHWERFVQVRRDLLAMADRLPAEARRLVEELRPISQSSAVSMFDEIVRWCRSRALGDDVHESP